MKDKDHNASLLCGGASAQAHTEPLPDDEHDGEDEEITAEELIKSQIHYALKYFSSGDRQKDVRAIIAQIEDEGYGKWISDGYHTFDELYDYRRAYNAALFNEWAAQGKHGVHKSWKHSDGEPCFGGGWFIVVAQLPTGMISNHYKTEYWNLFQCEERERSDEYDGHTPQIALQRLLTFVEEPQAPLSTTRIDRDESAAQESPSPSGDTLTRELEALKGARGHREGV